METLAAVLQEHWGLELERVHALSSGHTNKSFQVHCSAQVFVLRVSWAGKPAAQVQREASLLDVLHTVAVLPSLPRMRTTRAGLAYAQGHDGRWLHLFEQIPGSTGLPDDAATGTANAMQNLACLQAALAGIPQSEVNPVAWLRARHQRVSNRPAPPLPAQLRADYDILLARIGEHLGAAPDWVPGPVCWLHGDYHAGNLLFVDQAISGILDFDDVGQGSQALEAAFALFALARDTNIEHRFVFDTGLWDTGLHAYAQAQTRVASESLTGWRDALMHLFCADQVLIHLEAAQRGLWELGPGIGFLACWHQLLAGPPIRSA